MQRTKIIETEVSTETTAGAATSITSSGFTANWGAVSGAASYQLDLVRQRVRQVPHFLCFHKLYYSL
jgi:hypothetical protein